MRKTLSLVLDIKLKVFLNIQIGWRYQEGRWRMKCEAQMAAVDRQFNFESSGYS